MKLDRLELENWMGIPRLELEFGDGINLIYGRNEIGKSSVLESIRQALLGDSSSSKAEYKLLKPWGAKVKAGVNLHFTTGSGRKYRLAKSFPKGIGQLFAEGVPLTDDGKKTNSELFKVLGIPEASANLFELLFIDQGESLEIFNPKAREHLLDAGTRSYIKEVIKETAFKDVQKLEDRLNRELDAYLTGSRKQPSSKSEYKRLLTREEEKGLRLRDLENREKELLDKMEQMETADRELKELEQVKEEIQFLLKSLKQKKQEWDALEKREADLKPLTKDYEAFKTIGLELETIANKLPQLTALKEHRLEELNQRHLELENEKENAGETLDLLKQKKREGERIMEKERDFTSLESDFNEVAALTSKAAELEKELPGLLARLRAALVDDIASVARKLAARSQKETELAALENMLKNSTAATPDQLTELKNLAKQRDALHAKIANLRDELRLSFRLEAQKDTPVPFTYSADENEPVSGVAHSEPLMVDGFRQLDFKYPGHLNIKVAGQLAHTDMAELEQSAARIQLQLKEKLAFFGADGVDAVEDRYRQLQDKKKERELLTQTLEGTEKAESLNDRRNYLMEQLNAVKTQMEKLENAGFTAVGEDNAPDPGMRELDERYRNVTAAIQTEKRDIERVLDRRKCSVEQLEELYRKEKAELESIRDNFRAMPPLKIAHVTDTHLEAENKRLNDTDRRLMEIANDLGLLDAINIPIEWQDENTVEINDRIDGDFAGERSSQKIRDDIRETVTRKRELEDQLKSILGDCTEAEFKSQYIDRKHELEALREKIRKEPVPGIEPGAVASPGDAADRIVEIEKQIETAAEERLRIETRRAQLIGETGDFARLREERQELERQYLVLLKSIRAEIATISSLKLLMQIVTQEKAKAQEEVFKPLQERVAQSFSTLVGDRYRVDIDNDLNIEISGRTGTGEYEKNVDAAMSFGTREQLSFLFRLGIATQLSRKEPVVMVLDDSFVNTDSDRLPVLLDIIRQQANQLQFLVFTCRPEDYLNYFNDKNEKQLTGINLETLLKTSV